ncbi:MAG: hypothetical protein GF400_02330 [Candidatus Eisenbacteria bacterium]|nr:hypothetical protein [Candidatus Eisenbacteria bacterium]
MSPRNILVFALLFLAASLAGGKKLLPLHGPAPVAVRISDNVYTYYPLESGETMEIEVEGPVSFDAIARFRMEEDEAPFDVVVEVSLDGERRWREVFEAEDGGAGYPDMPGAAASLPHRITFDVPSGQHVVSLRLVGPEGVLDVNPLSRTPEVLPWRMRWRLESGVSYDSNIFRYGDPDIDGFREGERPYRYGMETVDDVRLEPELDLSFIREEPGMRKTELRLSADWRLAMLNGEKIFAKLGARLREQQEAAFFEMEYAAIPSYHLRLLWDTDAAGGDGEYRPCEFRKHAFGLEMGSHRSLPVDLSGEFRLESYLYSPGFVEYDALARSVGVTATLRPVRGVRIDAGYELRSLLARGADEPGETRTTSDDSDTTYDQDEYSFRLRWAAGRWWGRPAVVYGSVRHSRRYYLTPKSGAEDPYHAGREDRYWVVGGRVRLEFGDASGVEGFYQLRTRTSASPVVADIGDIKDYTAHRTGLMFYLERGRFLD